MASGPLNRRVFLQRAFAFSAAASLTGCGRSFTIAESQIQNTPAFPTPAEKPTDLLILGDWGYPGDNNQAVVATTMQAYIARHGLTPDALLMLGDNFYDQLPGGVNSSLWQSRFEQMYPASVFNCPAYAVAGNHDYQNAPHSKIAAELAYAAQGGTRWTMPSLYYKFTIPAQNPLLTVLALDSNTPNEPANPFPPDPSFFLPTQNHADNVLEWLTNQLQQPLSTPFLAVMAHHPVYSDGVFGDNGTLVRNWDPLLQQAGAHLYLSGHNHDLEHLEFAGHPTSFVVSGGGGAWLTPPNSAPARGPCCDEAHGFTHLRVQPDLMTIRQIDETGKVIHAFTKTPSGSVTLLP